MEAEKINIKFHKNCENTSKILKISRCHFLKFDIYFPGLSWEIFFGVKLQLTNYISLNFLMDSILNVFNCRQVVETFRLYGHSSRFADIIYFIKKRKTKLFLPPILNRVVSLFKLPVRNNKQLNYE